MRRLVEASRVRILRLSVAGPGGLVESRPELHMELVMTTRGCSWIPLATRRLIPSWRSPHRTPPFSVTGECVRAIADARPRSASKSATASDRLTTMRKNDRPPPHVVIEPAKRLLRKSSLLEARRQSTSRFQMQHWRRGTAARLRARSEPPASSDRAQGNRQLNRSLPCVACLPSRQAKTSPQPVAPLRRDRILATVSVRFQVVRQEPAAGRSPPPETSARMPVQ